MGEETKTPSAERLYPETVAELRARANEFNMLLPNFELDQHLPPGVKLRLAFVSMNPDPEGPDIYKIGVTGHGNESQTLYALQKAALNRIAWAMMIDVLPEPLPNRESHIKQVRANVWHRGADGSYAVRGAIGEFNIENAVEKARLALEEKRREKGGSIWRKEWQKDPSTKKSVQVLVEYKGAEADALIERDVREKRAFFSKHGMRLADTAARLAALRSFVAIRDGFTLADLLKPFVGYFYEFPPAGTAPAGSAPRR